MELKLVHLFPELMSLYGEYANLAVLRRKLELLNVAVRVEAVPYGEAPGFSDADFIYMGAGTELAQKAAMAALLPHGEDLKAALARGAVVLFTGSAMEVLGRSVTDAAGVVHPGLALAEFTTVETDRRDPVDAIARSALWEAPAVGFVNKCSLTHGVDEPLFHTLSLGFGNEADRGAEGYADGNLLATHLTGPVLVKNPELLDLIVRRLFAAKGWDCPAALPELPHQREAYAVTLAELEKRI